MNRTVGAETSATSITSLRTLTPVRVSTADLTTYQVSNSKYWKFSTDAKTVTVDFANLSMSSAYYLHFQLGTGTAVIDTGYHGTSASHGGSMGYMAADCVKGCYLSNDIGSNYKYSGTIQFKQVATNVWVYVLTAIRLAYSGASIPSNAQHLMYTSRGYITVSTPAERVYIQTYNAANSAATLIPSANMTLSGAVCVTYSF